MMKTFDQFEFSETMYEDQFLNSSSHQLTQFSPASSYDGSPNMRKRKQGGDSEEKRQRRLQRNREAAKRYYFLIRNRLKKKDWIEGLQKANRMAKETNARLKDRAALLEQELSHLQTLLAEAGHGSDTLTELNL
jgi:hypothetical protein